MYRWQEIYQELKTKITNNHYSNNDYLPTEHQLSIKYNVSRETIRKIYAQLESENYIVSIKNKGRIIKKSHISPHLKSFKDLTENKFNSIYEIVSNDENVINIVVKRYLNDNTLLIYVETKIYKEFIEYDSNSINEYISTNGILKFLNKYSKNKINNAVKRFVIEHDNVNALKELNSDYYILNDCLIFDEFDNIIEHSKNYYNPKYFEYYSYEKFKD